MYVAIVHNKIINYSPSLVEQDRQWSSSSSCCTYMRRVNRVVQNIENDCFPFCCHHFPTKLNTIDSFYSFSKNYFAYIYVTTHIHKHTFYIQKKTLGHWKISPKRETIFRKKGKPKEKDENKIYVQRVDIVFLTTPLTYIDVYLHTGCTMYENIFCTYTQFILRYFCTVYVCVCILPPYKLHSPLPQQKPYFEKPQP